MKTKTKIRFADLPKDYEGLCRGLLPRPIHDAVEYANVAEVADAMVLWQDDFTPDQADYTEPPRYPIGPDRPLGALLLGGGFVSDSGGVAAGKTAMGLSLCFQV